MGIKWSGGGGWVVVEIFITFFSHMKTKQNKPCVSGNTDKPEAWQPGFTAHSIYHSYYSGQPGCELLCDQAWYLYLHIYHSGWLGVGKPSSKFEITFSNSWGSGKFRIRFLKHFPSEYLNPCDFWGKFSPHVSYSFTLNSSNCCFVRVIWCPRSFMRVFYFFL